MCTTYMQRRKMGRAELQPANIELSSCERRVQMRAKKSQSRASGKKKEKKQGPPKSALRGEVAHARVAACACSFRSRHVWNVSLVVDTSIG